MPAAVSDKLGLLRKLDSVEPEKAIQRDDEQFRSMSLARGLRTLAELHPEEAYEACRAAALGALGAVPEPFPRGEE